MLKPHAPFHRNYLYSAQGASAWSKPVAMTEGYLNQWHDEKNPIYKFLVLSTSLFIVTMNPESILSLAGEKHYAMRLARGQNEHTAMENAENWCGRFSRYFGDIRTVEEIPLRDIRVIHHGTGLATDEVWASFRSEFAIDLEAEFGRELPVALGLEIDIAGEQWSLTSTLDSGLESFAEALISSTS